MLQRQALQHIVASTQRILSTLSCTLPVLHGQTPRPSPSTLSLAKSLERFRTTVLKSALLPQVSQVVISKATNLASFYEQSYQQACQRILALPNNVASEEAFASSTMHQLANTYRNLFENVVLPQFLADALKSQLTHNSRPSPDAKSPRPVRHQFNYEYVPFLEKYFEYNAYPTSVERLELAQQTKMTCRQIEVWFQNHRNRSKQIGKPLYRRTSDSCCKQMQQLFEQSSLPDLSGSDLELADEQSSTDEENEVPIGPDTINYLIASTAPPHAYPTKYPQQDVSDPFPTKDGRFYFPPPVWRRRVQTQNYNRDTTHVDIEELTIQFASKLHLREVPGRKRTARTRSTRSWLSPTIIRPCPAPLPALVRKSNHAQLYARSPPILSPTFFQSTTSSTSALSKKTLALPRRLPTWRLSHDANAPTSDFYALSGRGSMLQSRHSSSSSLSSMPATPPLSSTADGPQIVDFLDIDSSHFSTDFYSQTISSTLSKDPHSCYVPISPLSSHFDFGFSEI